MTESGICPKCGGDDLEYEAVEIDAVSMAYPFICKCGLTGYEVYAIDFVHMADKDGKPYA